MTADLVLRPSCDRCGGISNLYGSNCKHLTLCLSCGKNMAQNRAKCNFCCVVVSKLIREYTVRASSSVDKNLCIGRFTTGLPPFSKKKTAENKWSLHREGIQGRQPVNILQDKNKDKALVLEDETGEHQYRGQQLEGAQAATYYLLMLQAKEFIAVPACSWYNFNKVAQYKQLTLEEAEEKMSKRRNNATGYERWMMKAATNGAAAFGEMFKDGELKNGASDNIHPKGKSNEAGNNSRKVEQNVKHNDVSKSRLLANKKGIDNDDGEVTDNDAFDLEDDDIERGDDWEHEEIFTDDDEAVGNNPEEREDLAPELPAPPEIKQVDEDGGDEEGGLSKSGKELKKLLGRVGGLDESDTDVDEDEDDMDDDNDMSPMIAPRQDKVKVEPADSSPSKPLSSASVQGTPTTVPSKAKRKAGTDYVKSPNVAPSKKIKTESEARVVSAKDAVSSSPRCTVPPKASISESSRTELSQSVAPVTMEEIRTLLSSAAPLTTQDIVAQFKGRLKSQEDKSAFADMLKKLSKIQKVNGHSYVVLRDK